MSPLLLNLLRESQSLRPRFARSGPCRHGRAAGSCPPQLCPFAHPHKCCAGTSHTNRLCNGAICSGDPRLRRKPIARSSGANTGSSPASSSGGADERAPPLDVRQVLWFGRGIPLEGSRTRACRWTLATAHRQWNLGNLGHAEFVPSAGGDGWRIAPPVLVAGDPCRDGHALLCGARTAPMLARLSAIFGSQLSQRPQTGGPDIVQVNTPTARVLADQAAAAHIEIQWNAPLAILACCPRSSDLRLAPTDLPLGGWEVSRFSKSGLAWREVIGKSSN
jgi:hypothetical protein